MYQHIHTDLLCLALPSQENPTTILVQGLIDYLNQHGMSELASITRTVVLETSAEAARLTIDSLWEEQELNSTLEDSTTILLHLGVNYKGENFHLESCAHNEASFRVPDENGYQPKNVSILGDDSKVKLVLKTLLDVNSLAKQINQTIEMGGRENNALSACCRKAVVSNDPGRFVCNYLYCYSLEKFKSSKLHEPRDNPTQRTRCLFLHVPPINVVPQEQQFWFVSRLIEILFQNHTRSSA